MMNYLKKYNISEEEINDLKERKIEEMKNKNFSKKQIQMILMDEELYDKF